MADKLTPDAALTLHSTDAANASDGFQPVFQVLHVKKVSGNGPQTDRYRLILSDGAHFIQAMLATQHNHLLESQAVQKNTLVKLTSFALNMVQDRRLVIILGLEPVGQEDKIGDPKNVDTATAAEGAAPAPAAAAAAAKVKPEPVQQQQQKPQPAAKTGGFAASSKAGGSKGGRGNDHGPLYPIEGLSPYQNKWTIKARVTQKSDIKHWSNARGEGKLFSCTFMDETGEIRATGFNEEVDKWFDFLTEGKVYFVSKARINIAKKQFSNVNNDYEITLSRETDIEASNDEGAVPQVKYNFVELASLDQMEKDQTCDVLAVVKEVGELGSITGKASQKPISKRDITLVDRSEFQVRLTLWGKQAENYSIADQPVIAFKGVKVGDFGGRTLSMFSSSTMSVSPDIPEAHGLRGWFDSAASSTSFKSHSRDGGAAGAAAGTGRTDAFKTILEIKDENIGMNDKPDYVSIRATVLFVKKDNISYPACPGEGCQKKVTDTGDGWRCEKCDRTYPAPNHRYIMSLSVGDYTGQMWLTGFNEIGESLIGMNANELLALKETDEPKFEREVGKAVGKVMNFNCQGKMDTFGDQARARFSIRRAGEPDFKLEAKNLIALIKEYD